MISFSRHAGREGHRVLLGDADVVGPLGNLARELVDARAAAHRRGDAHDLGVFLGDAHQRLAENIGVCRNRPLFFFGFAGEHVKRRDGVKFDRIGFRRGVTLALLGHHVNQTWDRRPS